MKTTLMILFLAGCIYGKGQTYAETFRQTKTQKEYLLQQIAALKVYAGYVEKGYSIAKEGLNVIQTIKKGDFNLHSGYFSSLGYVNPNVRKYSKAKAIVSMQDAITRQVGSTVELCRTGKQLTAAELEYLQQSFDRLLDDCAGDLDELNALVTDGRLKMKDDERIKAIDKLYDKTIDKQVFVQSFSSKVKTLSLQRLKDAADISISKRLNELP